MTREEADELKARMKERDDDNGGEPLNAIDRGYHLAYGHLCKEIENFVTKQEPCEDCCNGDQIEKAKLCQRSYIAGMEHKQELKTDVLDEIRAEIEQLPTNYIEIQRPHSTVERDVVELGAIMRIINKYRRRGMI